jgi:hypothetical protein
MEVNIIFLACDTVYFDRHEPMINKSLSNILYSTTYLKAIILMQPSQVLTFLGHTALTWEPDRELLTFMYG